MKKNSHTLRLCILLMLAAFLLFACSFSLPTASKGTGPLSFQSSADLLTDPTLGLADLKSYHVSFRQDVSGELDGSPFERHTSLELTRLEGQADFTRAIAGTLELPSYFRLVTTAQAVYRWNSLDESCQGEAGTMLAGEMVEPALLLLPVFKTTRVGNETVNQVAAVHYHFDEGGLALTSPKPSASGEIWLAEQGGAVIKYTLNASRPAATSGKGMEVGQTITYELSQVNAVEALALPQGCQAVPVELPAVAGATDITHHSGTMEYATDSSAAEVVDFYFHNLDPLGWTTIQVQPAGDLKLPVGLIFFKGEERLSININEAEAGGLDVSLVVYNPSEQAAALPGEPTAVPTPAGPLPTIDASQSGLPEDVPLYPGAAGLRVLGNVGIEFTAPGSIDQVGAFYREQMAAAGWSLLTENTDGGQVVQIWQKAERMTSIQVSVVEGRTDVIVVMSNS